MREDRGKWESVFRVFVFPWNFIIDFHPHLTQQLSIIENRCQLSESISSCHNFPTIFLISIIVSTSNPIKINQLRLPRAKHQHDSSISPRTMTKPRASNPQITKIISTIGKSSGNSTVSIEASSG
jgi:hypothetical protein